MGGWGKIIGGMAGFAMGGPFGAVMGMALGHAADQGGAGAMRMGLGDFGFHPARLAGLLGGRDQVFAIGSIILSAKLAKCDGPVKREEIAAFKTHFRVPPEGQRDVARLFDQARDSPDGYQPYARQMGESFADNPGVLEGVLAALFAIALADGPVNRAELDYLSRVHVLFRLTQAGWDRARGAAPRTPPPGANEADPYSVLGIARSASSDEIRATWKRLVRENHPDTLAARGVPPDFAARATSTVAAINAAWDRIKRERGL